MGPCCSFFEDNKASRSTDLDSKKEPLPATGDQGTTTHQLPHQRRSRLIKSRCHHVYDGDTLTLDDNDEPDKRTRVRLVGIDAPEIKEHEEGAADAKDFLKKRCDKKDIEIEVDTREEKDKYGRLIGLVYVVQEGKRLCANSELLSRGLVSFYQPKGALSFVEMQEALLTLQAAALTKRLGIWKKFVDDDVYKTTNGGSFHQSSCEHVQGKRMDKVKRSECLSQGMSACRTCAP